MASDTELGQTGQEPRLCDALLAARDRCIASTDYQRGVRQGIQNAFLIAKPYEYARLAAEQERDTARNLLKKANENLAATLEERDQAKAEVARLRAGIEALIVSLKPSDKPFQMFPRVHILGNRGEGGAEAALEPQEGQDNGNPA